MANKKRNQTIQQKHYIVLTSQSNEPFGFGSAAPARPAPNFQNIPGPGKYSPQQNNTHIYSNRGYGTGFTSNVSRRLEFAKGNKNPSPDSYSPNVKSHKIQPKIGTIPRGHRVSCYANEKETAMTPGPGSYNLPELQRPNVPSFHRPERKKTYLPSINGKSQSYFDGRNLILSFDGS